MGGIPLQVLQLLRKRRHELYTTPKIVTELSGVVARSKFARVLIQRRQTPQSLVDEMLRFSTLIPDYRSPISIPVDPSDEKFLACAVTAKAAVLVSGDRHLLELGSVAGIPILTPRQFLARMKL